MKKFFTTFLMATITAVCFAGGVAEKIRWYQGSSFSTKIPVNGTVTSLGRVYGMFENGETVSVNDGYSATVSGPNGYTYSGSIAQPVAGQYDATGQLVVVGQPGIQFNCSSDTYGTKNPGEYEVTVPAGAFTVDGTANEEFKVTFTVADTRAYQKINIEFSVNPDPAVPVDELSEVLLTMNNKDEETGRRMYMLLGVNSAAKVMMTTAGGDAVECEFEAAPAATDKLSFKVKAPLGVDFSNGGRYTITVPEGAIRLESQTSSTYYTNAAVVFNYTLTGNGTVNTVGDKVKWYMGSTYATKLPVPENNVVQSLARLYGEVQGATVKVASGRPEARITGPEGYDVTNEIIQARATDYTTGEIADMPAFQLNCADNAAGVVNIPGEYTIEIPAGAFTVDGKANEAITLKLTVKDTRVYKPFPGKFTVFPDPDLEHEKLTNFSLKFDRNAPDGTRLYGGCTVQPGSYGTISKLGSDEVYKLDFKTDAGTFGDVWAYKLVFPGSFSIQENATFVVNIPAGQMIIRSEVSEEWYTNEELTYTYVLGTGGQVTDKNYTNTKPVIIPAEGDLQAFAGLQFETPNFEKYIMELTPEANSTVKFTVTGPDGLSDEYEPTVSPNYAYINLPFYQIYTTPGEYKVNVPKGSFKYIDVDTNQEFYTNGFDVVYNVTGGTVAELDYALSTPSGELSKEGASTYSLDYVYVKFAEEVTATDLVYADVVFPDNTVKHIRASWASGTQRFMLDFGYPKDKGEYKVTFPAGAARNAEGKFNDSFEFVMNVIDQKTEDIEFTTNPESGTNVTSLLEIEINAPAGVKELKRYLTGITKTYFYNDADRDNRQMRYLQAVSATTLKVTLNEEVTEVGDYTLEVPAESIVCVKDDNTQVMAAATAFYWSIRNSGAVSVGMDADDSYNVYDLNGVCIVKNGSVEDLDNLAKGVYIINGKKFIIR